jgi:putative alpha-1,2-mannosidase
MYKHDNVVDEGAAMFLLGRGKRVRFTVTVPAVVALLAGVTLVAAAPGTAVAASPPNGLVRDPASLVDPMIGTGSGGATVGQIDTFPGASAPFGMLSFSPDTSSRPDGGGYNYADSSITGFSLTHLSGPGCGADGDFPILPTVGSIGDDPADAAQPFDHADEQAAPGRYRVTLAPGTSSAVDADLAATTRTGIGTFTYPSTTAANMLFKIGDAQSGNTVADLQISGDEVTGDETAGQFCGSAGTYPIHFVAKFSRPFTSYGTWQTEPTGPNVFTQPTGSLDWGYHEVSSGSTTPTITSTTTSAGASAIGWQQATAEANTWIQANPPALTQGDTYLLSATVQGEGDVYLDFYNGQEDVASQPVNLTGTPTTLTVAATVPTGAIGAPVVQVRTADTGPVNLEASALSLQQESVVETTGSTRAKTHGTPVQRVPAAANGKAAGPVLTAPSGTEAKGGQSRTQVASATGLGSGAWVTFDTTRQASVTMKVAISYVSQADAGQNLRAEDPGWSTRAVAARTYAAWNGYLDRIRIGGGTAAEQSEFYTALYHALLDPNVFSDVNGAYLGFDDQVHRLPPGQGQYANYSGWDIYRSEVPLLAVVAPRQTSQMMSSLLNDQAQGGWLPKWGFANDYTDVMNGDAADPILAEAYAFGARDFDARAALAAMVKGATVVPTASQLGQGSYDERPDLADYESAGYVPNTQESSLSPVDNGASETLEYSAADFAISRLARGLGDTATATSFLQRSQNWTNVFNTATGYIEPRDGSGQFPELGPTTYGWSSFGQSGFQEGNAAQYTWSVPQDLGGLIGAIGGDAAAISRLGTFFQQFNAGPNAPYDWAGNEPSFGTPWVYDYAGAPYLTQQVVHKLLTSVYSDSPGGEPGNDDLGSMSSWYVWASLGLYPETPGTSVLALDAPIFSRAEFDVPGRPRVTISAPGASTSSYIQGVTVNGRPSQDAWLPGTVFGASGASGASAAGTTDIGFSLAGTANTAWGSAPADAPPSYQAGTLTFPPGRTPETLVPTGPNLLGAAPTSQLDWQGPVENGVGSVPGTITPDVTTPQGASAVEWQEADAAPNTWIWINPASDLTGGQMYQATITLQGTGDVYLDFYNGQEDLTTETVQLTATPVTLTVDVEVPSDYSAPLQVRTADAGPVDLYASGASIQLLTLEAGG